MTLKEYQQYKRVKLAKEVSVAFLSCSTLLNDAGSQFKNIAMNIKKLKSCMERHKISGSGDNR
ncbi:pyrophosphatase [Prevotella sp. MGM1]|nr:pyrophosphatase [Prevotella sp. MGM1]